MEILLLYNLISLTIVTMLLILCKKVIKNERVKDLVLKIVSVTVVIIHYSSLYIDFFKNNGQAMIENNMILPVYPCNIVMWLLLIVAFFKNKNSKVYRILTEFTFIGGTLCGLIGVLFNINFLAKPELSDYNIFKGLISHTVMIFGTIYLGVLGYVKIRVKNTTESIFWGLVTFSVIGFIINVLFYIFEIPGVNAMFMMEPPFENLPFINFITIGISGMLLSFIGLNIYERFTLPKEERWLTKFMKKRRIK